MNKTKKKIIMVLFGVGIPIILVINGILFYWMPREYIGPDGQYTQEAFTWLARWTAPLSMVTAMMILAILYRLWSSKNSKNG
ncbi:MAG: hypothetical protein IEMM0008_0263 [bacterium]|nr:MAG: hypothetical protein IEMM0008_0263 [bacterium]